MGADKTDFATSNTMKGYDMTSQAKSSRRRATWYGDHGETLQVVSADGLCLAEFSRPVPPDEPGGVVMVEISLQPHDGRGLPRGGPVVVDRERVTLTTPPGSPRQGGRFWLPDGWTADEWRECYFRVTPAETSRPGT